MCKVTKDGKRFCPDSKGIPEQVIEEAFIESYKMLCADNKDVLDEFISRVEKTLSEDSAKDKVLKLQKVQIIFKQREKSYWKITLKELLHRTSMKKQM